MKYNWFCKLRQTNIFFMGAIVFIQTVNLVPKRPHVITMVNEVKVNKSKVPQLRLANTVSIDLDA